jgi:hypothetical protein
MGSTIAPKTRSCQLQSLNDWTPRTWLPVAGLPPNASTTIQAQSSMYGYKFETRQTALAMKATDRDRQRTGAADIERGADLALRLDEE